MIKIKIDVTKITKEKLFKGQKGTYLNAVLIETPQSQYSDYMLIESITKEEKEQGVKGVIIGNAYNIVFDKKEETATETETETTITDDLPFIVTILLAVGSFSLYL